MRLEKTIEQGADMGDRPEEKQVIENGETEPEPEALSPTDPTSYSNPEDVLLKHLDLDLAIDFKKKILFGEANLTVEKLQPDADVVILDAREITIFSITDKATGQDLKYTADEPLEIFGYKLSIQLPSLTDNTGVICIKYEISPDCSALQWLRPEQTAGKRQPYMFSQCQAIHCRSLIPCQDTPTVKVTYTAKITAPKEVKVLMSAKLDSCEPLPNDPDREISCFHQNVNMPCCLIAIVAGDIVSRDIGPRSKVWSEPERIDAAAFEFAETEKMLKVAEDLCGPYVWGHYDILVLPPSFPYGGMENPCLTFVTPTLLAGDRSLVDVIAHEISHSWTGNLVTNTTFEHFWLNESHTEFIERKILGRLRKGEKFRQFLAAKGWEDLYECVEELGWDSPFTRLVVDLKGVDPDDAYSTVPYEKGHALLMYLESLVGGPEAFEPFIRAYIDKFKYKSIDSHDWKEFVLSFFHEQTAAGVFDVVDWDEWFYGLGMPPVKPDYDSSMADVIDELSEKWQKAGDDELDQFTFNDIRTMLPVQIEHFLYTFIDQPPLSHAKIIKMGEVYLFKNFTQNAEIRFRWLRLCIRSKYEPIIPYAIRMVSLQGRMKFTRPLYRDLYDWELSQEKALATFKARRRHMHNTTEYLVAKDLELDE